MPTKETRKMPARTNADIARAIWNDASQEYQRRIPAPDQGDISTTFKMLMDNQFRPQLNEFIDALVNRIGDVIYKSKTYTNPLGEFKRGMMYYGDTIEEIATGILQAKRFDPNVCYEDVFACSPPELMSNFHSINRQDRYDLTISQPMLKRAFIDNYGFQTLLNNVMSVPYTSDEYDEFLIMRNLFAEMAAIDGFYKVQVPDASAAATVEQREYAAREITEAIRARAGRLKFLSGNFNSAGVPTRTSPEDLVLFVTPEFSAMLDVNVIAFAFNASAADVRVRIIEVDDFGIDGCQAILADRDIFVCADTLLEFESIYNPKGLSWNYFLHHHGIYSMSRFVNAIMFTTEAGTTVTVPTIKATGVTVTFAELKDGTTPTNAQRGKRTRLKAEVAGTVTPETPGYSVPQGVAWAITSTSGQPLKMGTYIDAEGVLHVAEDEQNNVLTITATSVYIDPEVPIAEQEYQSGQLEVTIVGTLTNGTPEVSTMSQKGNVAVKKSEKE